MTSTAGAVSPSTRTVERALGLLASVCDSGAISLSDCARSEGLATSTALRLLRTLEIAGFVRRDGEGIFHAGPRLIQIGAVALGREELVKAAEPALRRIVDASGESSYLSILGSGDRALYVGMVEGTHAVRHTSWVGRTIPLYGTAAGAALRGDIPECGYVVVRSVVEPDVSSVAAPIRRPGGIAGALSVVGPTYRIDETQAEIFGQLVRNEALALAAQFNMAHSNSA
jgi:IclR family acetate operon transcriptional repressor